MGNFTHISTACTLALFAACAADDPDAGTSDAPPAETADAQAPAPDTSIPADETTAGADDIDTSAQDGAEPEVPGPVELAPPPVIGPRAATDLDPAHGVVSIALKASEMRKRLLDVQLSMYGYDSEYPGPTIQAWVGDEVRVRFENDLPEATTIHWHGLRIPDWMDGNPRIQAPVEPGASFDYVFVVPEAGTFWYHPHVRTNEQVEKGLYGAFIVHEREPPVVDADRVFFLDDMLLDAGGFPPFLANHMEAMHGRLGNTLVTNGKADTLAITAHAGQVERWRLVNPSNARTLSLSIEGATWRVMGTDGGLIAEPYHVDRLTLAVGQRFDLEVRFETEGPARLLSHVLSMTPSGTAEELAIPVVEVEVGPALGPETEARWPVIAPLSPRLPTVDEVLELDVENGPHGVMWTINGQAHGESFLFRHPQGTTASIFLFNRAGPEHPFHLHGQFFEIVGRDGEPYDAEPGLKDTVLIPGMSSVELRAYLDNPGSWMAHCHILEHAELGMMSQFEVSAQATP